MLHSVPTKTGFVSQAFGLRWHSDWPIPWFADAPDDGRRADIEVLRSDVLEPRLGGRAINRGELFADGTRFSLDGAVIDMFDGDRVRWFAPGLREVPLPLTSTVAAHVLAWRGLVPLHGSAVAFDGKAILIAGVSGAGKSTLAHALVECGGKLISDDLSALLPLVAGGTPMLLPGRPAIRLNQAGGGAGVPKRLALPPRVDPDHPVPLSLLLLLGRGPAGDSAAAAASRLVAQLFRPNWMRVLPHATSRIATLLHASTRIRIATMPPALDVPDVPPAERAAAALALLRQCGAR